MPHTGTTTSSGCHHCPLLSAVIRSVLAFERCGTIGAAVHGIQHHPLVSLRQLTLILHQFEQNISNCLRATTGLQ